jgi:ATP-dependent Zn protease
MWLSNKYGQMGGGMFGIGKSQAKRYDESPAAARVTFADVAGINEAREELVEVVDFLKSPGKYTRLHANPNHSTFELHALGGIG